MADISYTTESLKIENLFVDGDTRTITLKNPKSEITTQEILTLQTFMQQNNVIIGDKYRGTFGRIESIKRVTETRTALDWANG